MNKRKMVKGLLFAALAACFTFGGSFLTLKKGAADSLPPSYKQTQEKQAFHTVTFMVLGEVYALFEYVEDGTSLGEAMLADVCLAGYKFLGWTYGEGLPFTKDTPILSDMTVTAVLELTAYMVGDKYYKTLDEAYAQTGEEVLLISDVDDLLVTTGAPTLNLNGNSVGDIRIEGGMLTLYGGRVTGGITLVEGALIVKGGSYNVDVSAYLADGYHCIQTDGVYTVNKHEKRTVEGYLPTCTEKGLTDGEVCTLCGATLLAQESIEALGHTPQTLEGVEATCQTQGKTEGSKCSVCGEILRAQADVPITEHCYQEGACVYCGEVEKDAADSTSAASSTSTSSSNVESSSVEATTSQSETSSVEASASIDETTSEEGEEGCAGTVGFSFAGWALAIGLAAFWRKRKTSLLR